MTHEEIKILISAYIDGEVTPSEKNIVEEHLSACPSCQKDYKAYTAMSSSLSKWSDETLSPDEQIKIQKRFEQRRESMFTKRTATLFVTTLCLALVIGSVLQINMKTGVQGRLRSAVDRVGGQYSQGNIHARDAAKYGPYYMMSSYSAVSRDIKNKRLAENSVSEEESSLGGRVRSGSESAIYKSQRLPASYPASPLGAAGGMDYSEPGVSGTANYYQNSAGSYYGTDEERKKIQKAEISLLVDNAFKAKSQLTDLILQFNGIIMSSEFNRSIDGAGRGTMVCKVYPKDLEHVLQQIRKLGEVENEIENSADVTDQYNDAQQNILKFTSDKDRLQKSLNGFKLLNPTTSEERESAQRQIAQTEEEIKALDRVIKFYQEQTSMSLIVVDFYDNYKNTVKENDSINKWKAMFDNKWKATRDTSLDVFSSIFFGIILLLSYLVPVLIWCTVLGGIYFMIRMFFKK